MKVAVLTICYNEEETIGAVIKNWHGKVFNHLVLHSKKPWHGQGLPPDKTEEIVRSFTNTEFIRMDWRSEKEQRNWGLAYLYDYDYVLIVDADELYTEEDQIKILSTIGVKERFQDNTWCYRISKVVTYFKNLDYVLDPGDTHEPAIAVNPKKILFNDCRIPDSQYQIPIDVKMHHITYCRNNKRLFHKLQQFEHFNQVKKDWFKDVWLNWKPEMEDVRAYGHETSKAIYQPAPEEIKKYFTKV